jgi:hypothetical protein
VFLFFSVARSQDNGQWERATETAPNDEAINTAKPTKTAKPQAPSFGANMPLMSSAFDTAMWLAAA